MPIQLLFVLLLRFAGPFGDYWHTKEGVSAGNEGGEWLLSSTCVRLAFSVDATVGAIAGAIDAAS